MSIMQRGIELIQLRDEIETDESRKTLYETANELRIDIILGYLYPNMSSEETKEKLMETINRNIDLMGVSKEEKERLRRYFEEYYSTENNV